MAMNLLIEAGRRETRGPKTKADIREPPSRGYMDDLTITTTTHIQARWVLGAMEETATWARMKFKPSKSRCLVVKKGKITQRFTLKIQGEQKPSIIDNPIKCLGKWYDDTLKDANNSRRLERETIEKLVNIDKTGLPGKFKAWIFQHGLLPRLIWPLMLYDIAITTVEGIERKINRYLRRWMGVPQSFSSVGFYSKTTKLRLPLTSVVEEFKTGKARLIMTLTDSNDPKVREAGAYIQSGHKWKANDAVSEAESRLRHKDIVGTTCKGRQGLGKESTTRWTGASAHERRKLVQQEIRQQEEETRCVKAVEMGNQGNWTRWETEQRELTWSDIWKYTSFQLQFLLRAVYDVLPTPTNLRTWGLTEDPMCTLCQKPANLEHILSSCQVALTQGRYTWRHNQVLRALAHTLETERKKDHRQSEHPRFISFVRSGQQSTGTTHSAERAY